MIALDCEQVIKAHLAHIGEGFSCHRRGDLLWIASPYALPDGGILAVAVQTLSTGKVMVSDFGETLRNLDSLGFDPRATVASTYQLEEVLKPHHVTLSRGMIGKEVGPHEVGRATHDVLSACFGVAHLLVPARQPRQPEFPNEVAAYLIEQRIQFAPSHAILAPSGRQYTVSFAVPRAGDESLLLHALSPQTTNSVTGTVNATVRMWTDLKDRAYKTTLLDDRRLQWRRPDVAILREVSDVYLWSARHDELEPILVGRN